MADETSVSAPPGSRLHSGIVTSRFDESCEFYFRNFGFSPLEITEDYALLGRPDGSRLGVLRAAGEGQPAALQGPTRGSGHWLALEVEDPDALHVRLRERGVEIVSEPESTLSGVRRCVVRDPNGVLIYLANPPLRNISTPSTIHSYHD
jgi:catechol 2,3-dioxygenase-like lactoylglutathione lyase family enzyme